MLNTLMVLLALTIGLEASAQDRPDIGLRRSCPESPAPTNVRSMEELSPILQSNRIEILSGNTVTPLNVEKFLIEYEKMPIHFKNELLSNRASIRIMEGTGVGIDPSLRETKTTEGTREWINVPGGGGFPKSRVPMRIAINHLHDSTHGASNLFLHEHAHTLDSLYGNHTLSSSPLFLNLINNAPRSHEFLRKLCSNNYCTPDKPIEAFAELFSYYHGCDATRTHMEQSVPEIAEFFRNFNSGLDLKNGRMANWSPLPDAPAVAASPEAQGEECDTSPTSDFNHSINDFKKITNELSRSLPNGAVSTPLRSSSSSVSAAGLK